jgi:hypothetical protein
VAPRKSKPMTKGANSAKISGSQTTEYPVSSSKRKHSSFENTDGGGSISKRRGVSIFILLPIVN